jgi:hypothetical protein
MEKNDFVSFRDLANMTGMAGPGDGFARGAPGRPERSDAWPAEAPRRRPRIRPAHKPRRPALPDYPLDTCKTIALNPN